MKKLAIFKKHKTKNKYDFLAMILFRNLNYDILVLIFIVNWANKFKNKENLNLILGLVQP